MKYRELLYNGEWDGDLYDEIDGWICDCCDEEQDENETKYHDEANGCDLCESCAQKHARELIAAYEAEMEGGEQA